MKKVLGLTAGFAMLFAYGFASAHPDITFVGLNTNKASVLNQSLALSSSGANEVNAGNDAIDNDIVTGNADVTAETANDLNLNATDVEVSSASDVAVVIGNQNDAYVENAQELGGNSGDNSVHADQDALANTITTGNVTVKGSIKKSPQGSGININLIGLRIGDPNLPCNCNTDDVTAEIFNDNYSAVASEIGAEGNSGTNDIDANQDVGSCTTCGGTGATIDTGNATVEGTIENDENQNQVDGDVNAHGDIVVGVANNNEVGGTEYDQESEFNAIGVLGNTGANEIAALQDVSGALVTTGVSLTKANIVNRKNISIVDFKF